MSLSSNKTEQDWVSVSHKGKETSPRLVWMQPRPFSFPWHLPSLANHLNSTNPPTTTGTHVLHHLSKTLMSFFFLFTLPVGWWQNAFKCSPFFLPVFLLFFRSDKWFRSVQRYRLYQKSYFIRIMLGVEQLSGHHQCEQCVDFFSSTVAYICFVGFVQRWAVVKRWTSDWAEGLVQSCQASVSAFYYDVTVLYLLTRSIFPLCSVSPLITGPQYL